MEPSLSAAINSRRQSHPGAGCSFTLICTFWPLILILLMSRLIFTTGAASYPDTAVKHTLKPAKLYLIKSLCSCSSTGIGSLKPQSFFFSRSTPPSREGTNRRRANKEEDVEHSSLMLPQTRPGDHFHIWSLLESVDCFRWGRSPAHMRPQQYSSDDE